MSKTQEILQELVKIPSLTPFDDNNAKQKEKFLVCEEALDYLEDIFIKTGAKTKKLTFEGGHEKWSYPVSNLYSEIVIGNPNSKDHKFICYMGHIDVVPTGEDSLWKYNPFSGKSTSGFIHGRGATDMKGSVASWITAVEDIKKNIGDDINLTIASIITSDEEWAAVNGSNKVLEWMKNENKNPDAVIVGEPSSSDYLGTHIKIGRRGSLVGYIEAKGVQGHRAYDDLFVNPNRALSYAMTILNSKQWKDGNKYFPNTTFETIAIDSGDFNASAIVPENAKSMWNIRFTDKQTKEKLVSDLQKILKSPPNWLKKHPDYEAAKDVVLKANLDTASIPYYSHPNSLAASAKEAIKSVLDIDAQYDGSGGTTDGRFVHQHFPKAQIIELGVPEKGGIVKGKIPIDYNKRGGMHQIDERVSVDDINDLRKLYINTVKNYSKGR